MKFKRGWKERFADKINRELRAYEKEGFLENNRWIICGIKDTIYLLGECINKDDYAFANGFQGFCKDMGIELELPHPHNPGKVIKEFGGQEI